MCMVDGTSDKLSEQTRRAFLAATGAGSTAALAGCIGGDDDSGGAVLEEVESVDRIRMKTSEQGTTANAANEALAAVLNEHLDDLTIEALTSNGTEENIGDIASGDIEMGFLQNWTAREFRDGVPPFDELDFQMAQIFHYYDLPWFFIADDTDLNSVEDIQDGMTVSPTPSGSGTAPGLERALEHATDAQYERISVSFGEQGGALNEGRMDVGVGTMMNFVITPGWLQQSIASVDDFRILDVGDETESAWEDDEDLLSQTLDTSLLEGADNDDVQVPGDVAAPTFSYNFVSRAELDYDAVMTFLEAMWEYRDELEEAFGIFAFHQDPDFWVENAYEGIPFHPAAADFYEEKGIWRDEFERADV